MKYNHVHCLAEGGIYAYSHAMSTDFTKNVVMLEWQGEVKQRWGPGCGVRALPSPQLLWKEEDYIKGGICTLLWNVKVNTTLEV